MIPSATHARRGLAAALCASLAAPISASAAPVAADDAYSVAEDNTLVVSDAPLISADFDGGGGPAISFDGDWDYLDEIENAEGNNDSYPTDAGGRDWRAGNYDTSTSTVGTWQSGAMPLQGGGVNGAPGAPDVLGGIGTGPQGQNLVTTYLFRNTFALSAAQAAISDWTASVLVDDGCIVYINGVEVARLFMPNGPVDTNTFANFGDESNVFDLPLALAGIITQGTNTIAIEVHQNTLTSSDAGISIALVPGASPTGGFVYEDDVFGTDLADYAEGNLDANGGFNGSGGLHVRVGEGNFFAPGAKSGGWRREFTLGSPATIAVSLRYRLVTSNGFDPNDFAEVVLDIDGTRYGSGQNNALDLIVDTGDTGWQTANEIIQLGTGIHTLTLGVFNNQSQRGNEFADVFFDDVEVEFQGGQGGLLQNDTGVSPTAVLDDDVSHGTLSLNADGTFVYTPNANFSGTDTFTYHANDATGDSNEATVTITVSAVNDPPVAADDSSYTAVEDTPLVVPVANSVLGNDTDEEDDTLVAFLAAPPTNGSLALNPNGTFTYTPNPNFFGIDTFAYFAHDGIDASGVATVTITVAGQDDPPITANDSYTANENQLLEITSSGGGTVVFSSDFESGTPPEFSGAGFPESVQGFAGFGPTGGEFGGQFFRNASGVVANNLQDPTTLTLTNLPPHTSISIGFLLAVIDGWSGFNNLAGFGQPDYFAVLLDGNPVFLHTLTNQADPLAASYAPPLGGLLAAPRDLGFTTGPNMLDSAFDMAREATLQDLPHSASTATIQFVAGGNGWDGGNDESWAMDNLVVAVGGIPRQPLVSRGGNWRYLDDGSDQGTAWRASAFDDASWADGDAQLGYGDGDETTTVSFGGDDGNKFATTYFRTQFGVGDPALFQDLVLRIVHDDSAAVHLNGTEVIRTNLAPGAVSGDFARGTMPNEIESVFFAHTLPASLLVAGTNTLAVEVHQADPGSSDLSFDLELEARSVQNQGGVLANDQEPDGQPLTAVLLIPPSNGTLDLQPDGTFTYMPGLNFHGTDTFSYIATDGTHGSIASATITVVPGPNDLPETMPDSYNVTEDNVLAVNAANGVLDNDIDPDMDPMTAVLHTQATSGVVVLGGDGAFTYTPNADFAGTDTFEYVVNDTIDDSFPTLVTVSVANENDRPDADDDSFVTQPGQPLNVPAAGVLANDTDADTGTTLTAQLATPASSGALNLASDGGFTFTPAGGGPGTATFTYRASDSLLDSDPATVTIHINGKPAAATESYPVTEDNVLSIPAASGVLDNDTDPENDTLNAVLVTTTGNGTLSLSPSGSFTYTPDANFAGTDSFTYSANDGLQDSAPVTVTINVIAENDPPAAADDEYALLIGSSLAIGPAEGVLANDADVDGPSVSASLAGDVSNGTLNLMIDGAFTYTPNPGFTGDDTFTYVATDGTLVSDPASVTLTVLPAAEAIVINEIMYHPASENSDEEFVELMNIGDAPVNVNGWQFTRGISYTLPDVTVPAGGFLVVAADTTTFAATYGAVPLLVGGWTGGLSNRGERLQLVDDTGLESDDLTYSDQGDWALRQSIIDGGEQGWIWFAAHDGGGSSLELVNPELTNRNGQNWQPSDGAPTPGAANSRAASDTAPLISKVKHAPPLPASSDTITVTADLKDSEDAMLSAVLHQRVSSSNPGPFVAVPMFDDGLHGDGQPNDGEFGATIAPSADGTVREFYVEASDGTHSRTWPAPTDTGQNANALFVVSDTAHTGEIPVYHKVISQPDEDRFPFNNRASNAELNTTFIGDNCGDIEIRYRCGMRIRGASSRNDNPPPVRVNIPSDDPWDGETRLNLNTQFTWNQFIGMKLFQASGLPAPDAKRVLLLRNGIERTEQGHEGYGSAVHVQPLQEEFLSEKIPDDDGGNLYKKVRPDVDWAYRNGNINAYEGDGWGKQTNSSANDWSDLDEWLRVMNEADNDPDYLAQVGAVANLDQWMRWFGVMTIIANGETNASNGTDDDYSIYRGLNDTRFIFLPHDLDTILGQGDGSRITDPEHTIFDMIEFGITLGPLDPLFQEQAILTSYYSALRDLLQTTFSPDEFNALIDNHLGGWVPQQIIDEIRGFIDQRRVYIAGLVDAALGPPPAPTPGTTAGSVTVPAPGPLYISEILANNVSAHQNGGVFPDVIELHNASGSAISLEGMSISDDPENPTRFVFPAGTTIGSGQRLVLYATSDPLVSGIRLGFGLESNGETVTLYDTVANGGATLDSVTYGLQIPDLSVGRTGAGATTWTLTQPTVGSANTAQPLGNPDTLRINEWLVRPDITFDRDFVELYNPDALPVALGGLAVTDEPVAYPQRHQLPDLSFIAASGFSVLFPVGSGGFSPGNASELPFKLSADHGWIAISGENGIEIDEVHYICQDDDVAFGRETDGSAAQVDFDLPTPGFSNSTDLAAEIDILQSLRITELMYHPVLGSDFEYLRLKNTGTSVINLGGIRLSDGVTLDLPAVALAAGEETLLVNSLPGFQALYGTALAVAGEYTGNLSNGGERVRLEITDRGYGILDFDYDDDWYPITDGGGSSLVVASESQARALWDEKEGWTALGPDLTTYGGWASSHFADGDLSVISRTADPERDTVVNALEFALNLIPTVSDSSGLPFAAIENGFLTLTYTVRKGADATVFAEVTGDMVTWNSGPAHLVETLIADDGATQTWKARDLVPLTEENQRFMRVQAIVP